MICDGIPKTAELDGQLVICNRAFEVAGPLICNGFPATIQETKTLPAFTKQLKLYLNGNPEN